MTRDARLAFAGGLLAGMLSAGCAGSGTSTMQWEYLNGPVAQDVTCLLPTPGTPGAVLAGTAGGDLYASENAGGSWKKISTVVTSRPILRLVRHPEDPSLLFAATEAGLYRSGNGGISWARVPLPTDSSASPACLTLAIDLWNTRTMFAGIRYHGLFKTTDGGLTWIRASGSGERMSVCSVNDIRINPTAPDIVYAAVGGIGITRSSDAGATWVPVSSGYTEPSMTPTHLLLNRRDPTTLLFATNDGSTYRSTNRGDSWSATRYGTREGPIYSLAIDPADPERLIAGTEGGMIVSSDFGSSWMHVAGGLPRLPVSICPGESKENPDLYAYGGGTGVQRSTDGGATWTRADAGLGAGTPDLVSTDPDGARIYAAVGPALLRFRQETQSWEPAMAGLKGEAIMALSYAPATGRIMYTATSTGTFHSTDAGDHWQPLPSRLPGTPGLLDSHPVIATRLFAGGGAGLYVSTDNGRSWTGGRPWTSGFDAWSLTYLPTNAGVIYGAAHDNGVILSSDGGFTWETISSGIRPASISLVTLHDEDSRTLFAWTRPGTCFRSTNRGLEWNRYAPAWKPTDTALLACDKYRPSSVVALVNGRDLYYSPTGGETWVLLAEAARRLEAVSIFWNARAAVVLVGVRDAGVYRLTLGELLARKFGG